MEDLSNNGSYLKVFEEYEGVRAFFSTKAGADTGWPYNNREVIDACRLGEAIPVGHFQTHSDKFMVIAERMKLAGQDIRYEDSDGAITNQTGVLLTTMHADCIPLFFYDPTKQVIGMVHSGWKGTVKEIGRKTAELMQTVYDCKPDDILVHIGPGISLCCFEVDKDVFEMFKNPEYTKKGEKYYIDLKKYNRRMLEDVGILPEHITVSEHCTCCEPELFASYRFDGSKLRMGGGICLMKENDCTCQITERQ